MEQYFEKDACTLVKVGITAFCLILYTLRVENLQDMF